jgi:hypothetical protein
LHPKGSTIERNYVQLWKNITNKKLGTTSNCTCKHMC